MAGVDPSLLERRVAVERLIERSGDALGQAIRAVDLKKLDSAGVRSIMMGLLLRARGPRRAMIARAAKKLMALHARREQALAEKKSIEGRMREMAAVAAIEVSGTVSVKTVLRIGEVTMAIREGDAETTDVTFCLGKKKDGDLAIRVVAN